MEQLINETIVQRVLNGTHNISDFEVLNAEDLLYPVPMGIVVLLSIFYGSISIIAVVGNSLVIWIVATTRQMQTITNLFIANLALADVIIGMFSIPFQFQAALLQRWNLPEFMCQFCPFVQIISVNVSVLTLTAIAVDRHRAILNPLRPRQSKYMSRLIIACVWLVSIILASPIVVALRVEQMKEIVERGNVHLIIDKPFCLNKNLNESQMLTYRYILVCVQYVIPFCVISFVYIQMAIRLWGSKTPGNAQNDRDVNLLKNKKKVIKMLVIVVILFGLCWLPLQTYNILQSTWPEVNGYRYINIIWFCSDWLAMSNSCYNPFIYGIYNEKFKREFRKRCPLCRFGHDGNDYNEKSMYTRASSIRSNYTTLSARNKIVGSPLYGPAIQQHHHLLTTQANNQEIHDDLNKSSNFSKNSQSWHLTASPASSSVGATSGINNQNIQLTTSKDWKAKKSCAYAPKILYRQVNGSPSSLTNKQVLYQPIHTDLSTSKCSCNKEKDKSNDWSVCNNNEANESYNSISIRLPSAFDKTLSSNNSAQDMTIRNVSSNILSSTKDNKRLNGSMDTELQDFPKTTTYNNGKSENVVFEDIDL